MAEWHSIGSVDTLAEGSMQRVDVAEQILLLARVGGLYYATQGRCPHLKGMLALGKLEGQVVTCPRHGSQFNVITGKCLAWVEGLPGLVKQAARAISKPQDLVTFPTKLQGGQVWVLV